MLRKILVCGDFHIPTRAKRVPDKILDGMCSEKYDLILCTGDLTNETILEELIKMAPVKWVVGNMDYIDGPLEEKVTIEEFRIGLIHGTEIYPRGDIKKLYQRAVKMGVDVLISGHTHNLSIHLERNVLLLNPGSATGVWSGGIASLKPSFIILEIDDGKLKVKCFELTDNELIKKETSFRKTSKGVVEE